VTNFERLRLDCERLRLDWQAVRAAHIESVSGYNAAPTEKFWMGLTDFLNQKRRQAYMAYRAAGGKG